MSTHLVIGGARSGKSRFAQGMAEKHDKNICLIVTAEILDEEMAERVARHRAERPAHWKVVEAPRNLPEAIQDNAISGNFVLVDCLTLWLSNILCMAPDSLETRVGDLCNAIRQSRGQLVLVTNEVGWSIVPENSLARCFRDEQGRLNQRIAAIADKVTLVAAGLPLLLKDQ